MNCMSFACRCPDLVFAMKIGVPISFGLNALGRIRYAFVTRFQREFSLELALSAAKIGSLHVSLI